MIEADFIIIGAGIAGASGGYRLAEKHRVVVLERESQPGYHSTGRSAAMFTVAYGPPTIRALTAASRAFFDAPPAGFTAYPLLKHRGELLIDLSEDATAFEHHYQQAARFVSEMQRLTTEEICRLVPILRSERIHQGMLDPTAADIDTAALHQGFLNGMRRRGAVLNTGSEVIAMRFRQGRWEVQTPQECFCASVVINAAGAWCDHIARLAGIRPSGLQPKRRTAFTFTPPSELDITHWPIVASLDETFYFKPDAGLLLGTPCNADPVDAQDIQPEEIDIALGIDRIERVTTLTISRIQHSWAGLRSFVADGVPVVGFDASAEGFFWLAGQGGYGIQTSPALGELAGLLASRSPLSPSLAHIDLDSLSPARLTNE